MAPECPSASFLWWLKSLEPTSIGGCCKSVLLSRSKERILFKKIDVYSLLRLALHRCRHSKIHKRVVLGTPDTPHAVVVLSHPKNERRSIERRFPSRHLCSLLCVLIFIPDTITDHCTVFLKDNTILINNKNDCRRKMNVGPQHSFIPLATQMDTLR